MRISFVGITDSDETIVALDADAIDYLVHTLNVYADDTVRLASTADAGIAQSLHTTASYARSLASDLGYCDSPTDTGKSRAIVVQGRTMAVHDAH